MAGAPAADEVGSQSFVIKTWCDPIGDSTAWRGRITHVPSGAQRHVQSIGDISAFLATYLTPAPTTSLPARLRQWWRNLRKRCGLSKLLVFLIESSATSRPALPTT